MHALATNTANFCFIMLTIETNRPHTDNGDKSEELAGSHPKGAGVI